MALERVDAALAERYGELGVDRLVRPQVAGKPPSCGLAA